ncbi:MAG TPA: agmatine deiminase family protein [Actinomycetota bacterium]|nr:agmatine deiminase family protein [Actinomycetota bacterium]
MAMENPRADGFAMPAESAPHQATLMAWPARVDLWGAMLDRAKDEWAAVARAVAAYEPVTMVCPPGASREVGDRCGAGVEPLELPIDDSWMRDNGPIFVRNERGEVALVHFRFNSWGQKYLPYDKDARVPALLASHLGVRRYEAPFVLEGGSFFVDGEGTLLTTEQCLLHPNRNPSMSHAPRFDEDRKLLEGVRDARGRRFEVMDGPVNAWVDLEDVGPTVIPYMNHYLANGGVIVPVGDIPGDTVALDLLSKAYPDREVIGVPGAMISFAGGGPHCITQQVPAGSFVG